MMPDQRVGQLHRPALVPEGLADPLVDRVVQDQEVADLLPLQRNLAVEAVARLILRVRGWNVLQEA